MAPKILRDPDYLVSFLFATELSSTYFHRHPMMGIYGEQNQSRNGSKNHFFCLSIGAPFSHHLDRRSQGQKRMRPLTSSVKMVSCSPPMQHLPGLKSDSVRWLTVFSRPQEVHAPGHTDLARDRSIPHEVEFHYKN